MSDIFIKDFINFIFNIFLIFLQIPFKFQLQAKEESDRNSMSSLRQQIKLLEQNVEIERNNSKGNYNKF